MPLANRDASELTRKRRAMALYAYNAQLRTAQTSADGSVRREQNSSVTLDIVTARKQGGCYCVCAADPNGCYEKTSCGC